MRTNYTQELEGPTYSLRAWEEIVLWWVLKHRTGKLPPTHTESADYLAVSHERV